MVHKDEDGRKVDRQFVTMSTREDNTEDLMNLMIVILHALLITDSVQLVVSFYQLPLKEKHFHIAAGSIIALNLLFMCLALPRWCRVFYRCLFRKHKKSISGKVSARVDYSIKEADEAIVSGKRKRTEINAQAQNLQSDENQCHQNASNEAKTTLISSEQNTNPESEIAKPASDESELASSEALSLISQAKSANETEEANLLAKEPAQSKNEAGKEEILETIETLKVQASKKLEEILCPANLDTGLSKSCPTLGEMAFQKAEEVGIETANIQLIRPASESK